MATEQELREAIGLPNLILQTALAAAENALLPATLVIEGKIRTKVFTMGQKADGTPIGNYSTKPMSVHLPSLRAKYGGTLPLSGLQARGKPAAGRKRGSTTPRASTNESGDRVFRERTTLYLGGGYSEFRSIVNRQNTKVDLMLSGALAESMKTGTSKGEATIAFTRDEESEKADANEIRFGGVAGNDEPVIFIATAEDANELVETLTLAAEEAVAKLFTAS